MIIWRFKMHYIVQANDTLGNLAYKYGTTVQAIMAANGLTNPDMIYAGQSLMIPMHHHHHAMHHWPMHDHHHHLHHRIHQLEAHMKHLDHRISRLEQAYHHH